MTPSVRKILELVLFRYPLSVDDVVASVAEAWASRGALLMLLDPGSSILRVAASHPGSPEADQVLRLPMGYGVIGLVAMALIIAACFWLYHRNTAAWERAAGAEDEPETTVAQ